MGEVAEMFDVNQSLIRFWEQKFEVLKPKKNKKGNRMFTPEDIKNFEMIYYLVKERGMTLAGARNYMNANRKAVERDTEIVRRLQTIRSLLLEIREELKETATPAGSLSPHGSPDRTAPVFGAVSEGVPVETAGEDTETVREKADRTLQQQAVHLQEEEIGDRETDEELVAPFTAQVLFAEESRSVSSSVPAEATPPPPEADEPAAPPIVDTQQSLF